MPAAARRSAVWWLVVPAFLVFGLLPVEAWWARGLVGALGGAAVAVCFLWITRQQPAKVEDSVKNEPPTAADPAALGSPMTVAPSLLGPDLLDAVDAAVIAASPGGEVVYCNAAAGRLLGLRPERAVGRRLEDVFTQPELLALFPGAARDQAAKAEVRVPSAEGPRTVEASATRAAGGGVVLALRDVTELSRAVQVKSEFVANASHELRTPITALRMAVETLAAGAADDPVVRGRLLETIAGNTARLEEMVRDLLDLSRLESPEWRVRVEPVPAAAVAEALTAQFEGVCRERNLTLTIDFGIEVLHTDRALLLVILRNLVENATKFAYEGTAVRVTGRGGGGGGMTIEVADRGIGIPIQHQQRVFERYYQVDAARTLTNQRRGSGLGLAIVKHAVRRLGGGVRLSSVWKEGTTVTVDLPAAAASSVGAGPGAAGSGP